MSTPHIALVGKIRSGKDTVGRHLIDYYGYTRFAFADGIRTVCRTLWPEQFANGAKPRATLQNVGQLMRQVDPDVWLNQTLRAIDTRGRVQRYFTDDEIPFRAVITDTRQPNEVAKLRQLGYTIVRVHCPDDIRVARARAAGDNFTDADLTHETESYVDAFNVDYEIVNVGTLDELSAQVDTMMDRLGVDRR